MPKASPIQTSFSGGEFSDFFKGRVDVERYKTGLDVCVNYYPTLQGPLIRRPGTKFVANVKDPAKPPALIPFQFSADQSYMLEAGDYYFRFYADEAQIITTSNLFKIAAFWGMPNKVTLMPFTSIRENVFPRADGEGTYQQSSVLPAGSVLEIQTPYSYLDTPNIKITQNADVLYLTHPDYPTYKLERWGATSWDLKPVIFKDGPYLPFNSYKTIGDNLDVTLTPSATGFGTITTGPEVAVYGAADNGKGNIRLTTPAHTFNVGDRIFVGGVTGALTANNGTSAIESSYWTVEAATSTTLDLAGSVYTGAATNSTGVVRPAVFEMARAPVAPSHNPVWADVGTVTTGSTAIIVRNIAFYSGAIRYWGHIVSVTNASVATFAMGEVVLPGTGAITTWQMGLWNGVNKFPGTGCFHQGRLALAGAENYPQQIDMSMSNDYERFAAAGSSLQVADSNAISIKLLSNETNQIQWIKSSNQGLLGGSVVAEWQIAPNNQNQALSPTNVNAQPTSYFGAANVDAVQSGNSTLYLQRGFRKLRDLNFYFQVGTFRSNDMTELAEHITAPAAIKLAIQKEPFPLVWALRTDGVLATMTHGRDEEQVKAGWARHILGGRSDSGGSSPQVNSMSVISASSATADQLWVTTKRFINGTSVVTVEVLTAPFRAPTAQEDSYHFDCGGTYDQPKAITNVSASAVITVAAHGFSDGDWFKVTDVKGINSSIVDVDGNVTTGNLFNDKTFYAAVAPDFPNQITPIQVDPASTGVSAYQRLAFQQTSALSAGAFYLTYGSSATGSIPYTYTAQQIENEINATIPGVEVFLNGGLNTTHPGLNITFGVPTGTPPYLMTVASNTVGVAALTQTFRVGFPEGYSLVSASSYSQYISGGYVRKLVSSISGYTWLKNETVGVLADGGIHPDVTVNSAGVLALSYPAAKVQVGYRYNSDGGILRTEAGSADGSSIGKTRRITRVAFLVASCGDFSFGPSFARLLPVDFNFGNQVQADIATPLFSGIVRDGVEAEYDFDGNLVFRQNSGLPGLVQSITLMMDEFDV